MLILENIARTNPTRKLSKSNNFLQIEDRFGEYRKPTDFICFEI